MGAATYRDIKADLMRRILGGEWPPGTAVPNEQDLAVEFGAARATVNRAMRELVEEGIVERKRKAGTRVRLSPVRTVRLQIPLIRKEVEEEGEVYGYVLIRSAILPAPDPQRARLGLLPGDEVLHLTCMHFANGLPYQLEDRMINLKAIAHARDIDFSRTVPVEWLVQQVPFSDVEISFSATSATEEQAHLLKCDTGQALFRIERLTRWQGQAITCVDLVYRHNHRITTRY